MIGPTLLHNFGRQTCLIFFTIWCDAASFIFQIIIQTAATFSILICSLNWFVIRKKCFLANRSDQKFYDLIFEVTTNQVGETIDKLAKRVGIDRHLFSLHKKVILGIFKSTLSTWFLLDWKKSLLSRLHPSIGQKILKLNDSIWKEVHLSLSISRIHLGRTKPLKKLQKDIFRTANSLR